VTIATAFLDYWVAAKGPPATILSDYGPQFRLTFFRRVRSLLRISKQHSTTYHPQTNDQLEQYNRTIVGQLRTYVEDRQDRLDELVSMLTLAYNSRPQQSTGVAPLEFVTPERVRTRGFQISDFMQQSDTIFGCQRAFQIYFLTRARFQIKISPLHRSPDQSFFLNHVFVRFLI